MSTNLTTGDDDTTDDHASPSSTSDYENTTTTTTTPTVTAPPPPVRSDTATTTTTTNTVAATDAAAAAATTAVVRGQDNRPPPLPPPATAAAAAHGMNDEQYDGFSFSTIQTTATTQQAQQSTAGRIVMVDSRTDSQIIRDTMAVMEESGGDDDNDGDDEDEDDEDNTAEPPSMSEVDFSEAFSTEDGASVSTASVRSPLMKQQQQQQQQQTKRLPSSESSSQPVIATGYANKNDDPHDCMAVDSETEAFRVVSSASKQQQHHQQQQQQVVDDDDDDITDAPAPATWNFMASFAGTANASVHKETEEQGQDDDDGDENDDDDDQPTKPVTGRGIDAFGNPFSESDDYTDTERNGHEEEEEEEETADPVEAIAKTGRSTSSKAAAAKKDQEEKAEEEEAAPATWNFMAGFTRSVKSDADQEEAAPKRPQFDAFGNRFESTDDEAYSEASGDEGDEEEEDDAELEAAVPSKKIKSSNKFGGTSDADSFEDDDHHHDFVDEDDLARQQQQTILKERQQRKQEAEEAYEEIDYLRSRAVCLCYTMIALVVVFVVIILCLYFLVWKDDSDGTQFVTVEDDPSYPLRHLPEYTQLAIETNPAAPQALAYTWINGEEDLNRTDDQKNNRFALATLYFSLSGSNWNSNRHWLSHNTECVWEGYQCGALRQREKEQAREDGLTASSSGTTIDGGTNSAFPIGLGIGSLSSIPINGNKRHNYLRRQLQLGWMKPSPETPYPTTSPRGSDLNIVTLSPTMALAEEESTTALASGSGVSEGLSNTNIVPQDNNGDIAANPAVTTIPEQNQEGGATFESATESPLALIRDDDPILTVIESDESLILQDNNLIGTIPREISLLTNTLYLLVFNNNPDLVGSIPSEIARIRGLASIQISRNGVTGRIPSELASLRRSLKSLYLHRNRLRGTIPSYLASMTKLTSLWLHRNELSGQIPNELFGLASTDEDPQMQQITELFLDHNQLTGTIPDPLNFNAPGDESEENIIDGLVLPGFIADDVKGSKRSLGSVKTLTLDNNKLTGSIPTSIGLYYKLETLTLHNNSFTGNIPQEVCSLFENGNLKSITIDCHRVKCDCQCECVTEEIKPVDNRPLYDTSTGVANPSGPVFESLPQESQMAIVDDPSSPQAMAFNWLHESPTAGEMSAASALSVSRGGGLRRQLTFDALQREQQKFALATFFFAMNGFSWIQNRNWISHQFHECDWWSRFSSTCSEDSSYESINLRENGLSGEVPLEVGLLTNLGWMELEDNTAMRGSIPELWGELTNLFFMSLRNASLTGTVPSVLGRLSLLKELDLSNNRLEGSIPNEVFQIESILKLAFANNSLSGTLPSVGPQMRNITDLYLQGNAFTGTIPTTLGLLSSLEVLWLHNNDLTGSVPFEVCRMKAEGNLVQLNIDCDKVDCTLCECTCGATEEMITRDTVFAVSPSEEANTQTFEQFQRESLPEFSQDATVDSPQAQALFWLGADYNFEAYNIDQRLQRFALATLFYSLDAGSWSDKTHWLSYDMSECEWYSTLQDQRICNDFGLYKTLHLDANGLYGSLPEELGVLSRLTELNLSGNRLRGGLPSTVGIMTEMMFMELDGSELSGTIPTEIGLMTKMSEFYIHNNKIHGKIPTQIGNLSTVLRVWLNSNQLEGPIPSEVGGLSNLRMFKASENRLTGQVPSEMGLFSNIKVLDLGANNLNGPLPSTLVNLLNIEELDLNQNALTGALPDIGSMSIKKLLLSNNTFSGPVSAAIGGMTQTQMLDLSYNALTGNVPSEIGLMTDLVTLDLSQNQLAGSLPTQVGRLRQLNNLDVSGNSFVGPVPSELWSLSKIRKVDLSSNEFVGQLPANFSNLKGISELNLSGNKISGVIPESIGDLTQLGIVDLGSNIFTGSLPTEIGKLGKVGRFFVSNNPNLGGPLPTEIGDMGFLRAFSIEKTSITGPIPSTIGNLKEITTLSLADNLLSGNIPDVFVGMSSLKSIALEFNNLHGTVPVSLCQLKESGSLESISVDCDKVLCYCECECLVDPRPNRGDIGGFNLPDMNYVFNETGWLVGDLYEKLPSYALENLANENSPQSQAYKWDLADTGASSLATEKRLERYAMASLFYSTQGDSWREKSNWLSTTVSPCDWYSTSTNTVCNPNGEVDNLDLVANGLNGPLPEELGLLSSMWVLSLGDNARLAGSLPTQIGLWSTAAVINVPDCGLTGRIPTEVGVMARYVHCLVLTDNSANVCSELDNK